jgi:predicted DCC family thiol-disulfide oxidoreductase YuxK
MLCWHSASELESPLLKWCAGVWAARESCTGPKSGTARAARLLGNHHGQGTHRTVVGASRQGISMTIERAIDPMASPSLTLVLYDGVCGLCNRLVSFLLRHDRRDQFRFAALQSPLARTLLNRYGLNPNDFETVVVLADFRQPHERALTRSQAALWAIGRLGGAWRSFAIARLFPFAMREELYGFIGRRRYQVFGKYDACPMPRPEDRHKFLDIP